MVEEFPAVARKSVPTMYFIGVTTQQSSIMKIFPRWMKVVGRADVVIEGVDLKIHDERSAYRAATAQIKYDPLSLGALVTTHKVDLFHAAEDLFDTVDHYAQITCEISCISKRDGKLEGHAKDPITCGLSMDAILGEGYFGAAGGNVLIFGAGGSATAAVLHLIMKPNPTDRPRQITVVDRLPERLDSLRAMVDSVGTDIKLKSVRNQDPRENDRLMAGLPDHSLVINATGMGKDIPGSPVTDAGLFPRGGIAWEFNYRGALDFLRQARAQAGSRALRIEDGWLYFLHGWTQVIAQVLHVDLHQELFSELAEAARSPG